ncbi:tripartite tricarboxylate transporter substrate binding protein [Bradyrhizobium sp. LHD-71]|uniref:Bug family tripartite tricarboxylate transporter substrate binding protein n=1 Tax=Bradyrhizobium sp. LHD-71 TaxID=3072141 RepID=UPI00280EFD89|nr:tripartite tricarboxylate transporter substrate binding protein [Bradyrhizobium sp. LHD-71]MDQ8730449.1 tripartite tricarboxylate transporter substrate binding protein [Bradyrhizobium sp. LHD-71]
MRRSRLMAVALGAALLPATVGQSAAQADYPTGTVRLISAFEVGGGNDFMARELAHQFSELYGKTFIVEARPGGNGDIATDYVARAKPDGNTLLVTTNATIVINPLMSENAARLDPETSLAPVSLLARQPFLLVVNPKLPVATLGELIDYARAHPGKLNFGSSGAGGGAHLAGEMLKSRLGLQMEHVPYKGIASALRDLVAGNIDFMFGAIQTVRPYVQNGQLRPLAVSSRERNHSMPDAPAVAEYPGLEGFESDLWYGLLAPAKTDPAILASLAQRTADVFKKPAVRARFEPFGTVLVGSTPAEFSASIKSDIVANGEVLKRAGLVAQK